MTFTRRPDLDKMPDGVPLAEIAAAHRVPLHVARRWLAPDPPTRPGRQRTSRQPTFDGEVIISFYRSGLTQRQVAASVGCSVDTVAHHVRAAGVARHGHPTLDAADIARRYQAGQSLADIATELGASRAGVSRALDRVGMKRRPWGSRPAGLKGSGRQRT